jgi:hypothetical protein|tara:strand:+ start:160 stop:516 length:357 start_codon:yes stop_codon:yes gene_type:complete
MTDTTRKSKRKPGENRGGARPGAGRPKGARDQVSIQSLLEALNDQTGGLDYESLLVADFLQCRMQNDKQTTLKYHNLILNKVMNSLTKIEVTDSKEAIEAKQVAFAEALAKLTGVNED